MVESCSGRTSTLTLLALGLLIGHTVLRGPGDKGWRAVSLLAVIPLLLAVLPPLLVQARFGGDLASSIVADLMRVNMHMNPFRLERWYKTLLPTVVAFLVVVGLGAWRSSTPASYRSLVLDAWIYSALLGCAHFLAVRWHSALVMTRGAAPLCEPGDRAVVAARRRVPERLAGKGIADKALGERAAAPAARAWRHGSNAGSGRSVRSR